MNTKSAPYNKRKILTPAEKQSINERIGDRQEDLVDSASHYNPENLRVNDPIQDASHEREQTVLKNGEPEPLNKHEKNQVEKRLNQNLDWLKKSMVPKSHINLKPGTDDNSFRKCVNEMAGKENSRQYQEVAQRCKNDLKLLGRDSNLESFRPATR